MSTKLRSCVGAISLARGISGARYLGTDAVEVPEQKGSPPGWPTMGRARLYALALALLCTAPGSADDPPSESISVTTAEAELDIDLADVIGETSDREEQVDEENGPQHLLLRNDRVLSGKIEKVDGGYDVIRSGGRITIPEGDVRATGRTKLELYEFKISQVPPHDVNEHLKIHKWCLSNGLEDQAQAELENMLQIAPDNREIQNRLRTLRAKTNLVSTSHVRRSMGRPSMPPPEKVIDTFIRGHGSETFLKYNSVERMLLNRCASGACHGSARHAGDFRLFGSERSKDPLLTARNLQTVMNAMDLKHPEQSIILYKSITPHGGAQIAALGGINDPDYRELRDWVFTVAENWSVDVAGLGEPPGMVAPVPGQFGSARNSMALQGPDPRYLRPEKPPRLPGSVAGDQHSSFSVMADDAPPAPPQEIPVTNIYTRSSSPSIVPEEEPSVGRSPAKPAASNPEMSGDSGEDPFDPNAFNQGPRPGNGETSSLQPGTTDPHSFTRPVAIPIDNRGGVFKAAPTPFGFLKKIRN